MNHVLEHLRPKPRFHLRVEANAIRVLHEGEELARLPLGLPSIYSLFDAMDTRLLSEGLSLGVSEKDLRTPLGFELFLQGIMMNMVHCVFPRFHVVAPLRERLPFQTMESEIQTILNTLCVNQLSHIHVCKDRLRGMPLLLALPGGSLDVDFVREHRKGFALMAAGRSAGRLLEAGVEPDIIYIQDINAKAWQANFGALGDRRLRSILVANPQGDIQSFHHNFARVYKAWNMYPFERDRFPKPEEIAPSTATGAYSIARLLGADPIVFMGNDCGVNTAPPEDARGAAQLTNLDFREEDGLLVFEPTTYDTGLFLRFADEMCVRTSNNYISGGQWIKMRVFQQLQEQRFAVHDISDTRFCQFNSAIAPPPDGLFREPQSMPPLPYYDNEANPARFLEHRRKTYSLILKHLNEGAVINSSLRKPFSCVYQGTAMLANDSIEPQGDDLRIARHNAEAILAVVEQALAGVQPSSK